MTTYIYGTMNRSASDLNAATAGTIKELMHNQRAVGMIFEVQGNETAMVRMVAGPACPEAALDMVKSMYPDAEVIDMRASGAIDSYDLH